MAKELKLPQNLADAIFTDRCIIFDRDGMPWQIDVDGGTISEVSIKKSAVHNRKRG